MKVMSWRLFRRSVEDEVIEVTEKPIEVWKVLQSVATEPAGGIVHFIGAIRRKKKIRGLFYECYPEMARQILREIVLETKKRWPVQEISVVHRYGSVEVGEPAVVIAVSSAHRREAFAACQFVIDQIKKIVPIWKKGLPPTPSLLRRGRGGGEGFRHAENE